MESGVHLPLSLGHVMRSKQIRFRTIEWLTELRPVLREIVAENKTKWRTKENET